MGGGAVVKYANVAAKLFPVIDKNNTIVYYCEKSELVKLCIVKFCPGAKFVSLFNFGAI